MAFSPPIMKAVETLGYRATLGEVASTAGLELNQTQQALYELAGATQAHLQVSETGDVVFEFPKNFRQILRNKFFKVRLQAWLNQAWHIVFVGIRISFGIILILSILLMSVALIVLTIAISTQGGDRDERSPRLDLGWLFWWGPDLFHLLNPRRSRYRTASKQRSAESSFNFLESVFSFLFGDGHPNPNLEQRQWQIIGQVIEHHDGAIIAEQLAPYVTKVSSVDLDQETFMLPVLARFNGYPEVSPEGELIYHFPELQVKAQARSTPAPVTFLREQPWVFTQAPTNQKFLAMGLGGVNLVLALMVGSLMQDTAAIAAIQVAPSLLFFLEFIYPILLCYGLAFLAIPLIRYFWIQQRNRKLIARNQQRQQLASHLNASQDLVLQQKLNYAREFSRQTVLTDEAIAYRTDQDLIEQRLKENEAIAQDWEKRLQGEP